MIKLHKAPLLEREARQLRSWLQLPESHLFRRQILCLAEEAQIGAMDLRMKVLQTPTSQINDDARSLELEAASIYRFLDLVEALATGQDKEGNAVEYISETKITSTI